MTKLFKTSKLLYVFAILAFSFTFTSSYVEAQESSKPKKQIKYKKARALQSKTAKQMAKVYEALELVNEEGEPSPDMEVVIEILTDLRNQKDDIKSYDRSVMWNAWGYVYYSDAKYLEAIDVYEYLMDELYKWILENNISKKSFEFQVLHGVPMHKKLKKLIDDGNTVRVYVPYGDNWYDYSVRRLKENPKMAGYIIKNLFSSIFRLK